MSNGPREGGDLPKRTPDKTMPPKQLKACLELTVAAVLQGALAKDRMDKENDQGNS